jgi:hypothetical protein
MPSGGHFGHHKGRSPKPGRAAGLANLLSGTGGKKSHKKAGGKHFGHSKGHQKKTRQGRRRKAQQFPQPGHAPLPTHSGLAQPAAAQGETMLPNLPPINTFFAQTMDVYTGVQNDPVPPAAGNRRATSINILVSGTFLEGTRSRTQAGFGYTHVILCDPSIEIRDYYSGNATTPNLASAPFPDILSIPGGTTAGGSGNNYWIAVFSFVTVIPGLGRRKVVLADRHSTIGNWPGLV